MLGAVFVIVFAAILLVVLFDWWLELEEGEEGK